MDDGWDSDDCEEAYDYGGAALATAAAASGVGAAGSGVIGIGTSLVGEVACDPDATFTVGPPASYWEAKVGGEPDHWSAPSFSLPDEAPPDSSFDQAAWDSSADQGFDYAASANAPSGGFDYDAGSGFDGPDSGGCGDCSGGAGSDSGGADSGTGPD